MNRHVERIAAALWLLSLVALPGAAAAGPTPAGLAFQPGHKMHAIKFLGWSASGQRFVLQTTHRVSKDGGEGAYDHRQYAVTVRQVHDTLSGRLVAAFRVKRVRDRGAPADRKLDRAWAQARPASGWKAFLAVNPLLNAKPGGSSPDGRWVLAGRGPRLLPAKTRLSLKSARRGLAFRFGQNNEHPARLETGPRGVWIQARLTDKAGKKEHALLRFLSPGAGQQQPSYKGSVLPHWGPAGRRVLLVVQAVEVTEVGYPRREARYYLRSVGPQIRMVHGPGNSAAARAVAARLAAAGLPVTNVQPGARAPKQTVVYHRPGAEALAGRAQKHLPRPNRKQALKGSKGWLQLIISVR